MDLPEWGALTGQSPEEMRGDGWMNALHPDDVERTRMAWKTSLSHASPFNTDYRVLGANRVYRWVNSRGVAIFNEDGSVSHWVGALLAVAGGHRPTQSGLSSRAHSSLMADGIRPSAIRAARGILNWSASELAAKSGLSLSTIRRLETDGVESDSFRPASVVNLLQALSDAKLQFIVEERIVIGVVGAA